MAGARVGAAAAAAPAAPRSADEDGEPGSERNEDEEPSLGCALNVGRAGETSESERGAPLASVSPAAPVVGDTADVGARYRGIDGRRKVIGLGQPASAATETSQGAAASCASSRCHVCCCCCCCCSRCSCRDARQEGKSGGTSASAKGELAVIANGLHAPIPDPDPAPHSAERSALPRLLLPLLLPGREPNQRAFSDCSASVACKWLLMSY